MLPRLWRTDFPDVFSFFDDWFRFSGIPSNYRGLDVGTGIKLNGTESGYTLEIAILGVNKDEIKAEYKDGILYVTLPKKKKTKSESKQIEIK